MAKKKSYYRQIMEAIDDLFPGLPYNEKQKYAGRINTYLKENEIDNSIEKIVSSYIGSEKNSSSTKTLRR